MHTAPEIQTYFYLFNSEKLKLPIGYEEHDKKQSIAQKIWEEKRA